MHGGAKSTHTRVYIAIVFVNDIATSCILHLFQCNDVVSTMMKNCRDLPCSYIYLPLPCSYIYLIIDHNRLT